MTRCFLFARIIYSPASHVLPADRCNCQFAAITGTTTVGEVEECAV